MGDVRVALRWDRLVGGSARSARVRRPLVAIVPPAVPRRRQFTHCACGARGRAPTKTPVGLRARARARHRQESAPLGGGERRLCRDAIWRERLTGAPVARRRTRLGEPRRRVRVSLRRVRARAAARRLRRCRCRRRCCEPGRPRRPPPRRDRTGARHSVAAPWLRRRLRRIHCALRAASRAPAVSSRRSVRSRCHVATGPEPAGTFD